MFPLLPKIAVINDSASPVPATRGGAVQTLTQLFLDENEHSPQFDFSVFSIHEPSAEKAAASYAHSRFFFYPPNVHIWQRRFRYRALHALSPILPQRTLDRLSAVSLSVEAFRNKLKNGAFNAVIVENRPHCIIPLRRLFPHTPIILHLHNSYVVRGCAREEAIAADTSAFFCVSNFICNQVKAAGSIAPENVFCLYNGIDVERFTRPVPAEKRAELRKHFGFAPTDFVFVFAGRTIKEKGIAELITAFTEAKKALGPAAKLLILGASDAAGSPIDWEIPNAPNIVFSGYINHEDMPATLQSADASVHPAIWEEPLSLAFIESLCAGLPSIITDSGGMVEAAENSGATIVPRGENLPHRLAKAMIAIAKTPEPERQKLSERARARGAFFSKERYFNRFCDLLNTVLQR